jgi:hypothetical protein
MPLVKASELVDMSASSATLTIDYQNEFTPCEHALSEVSGEGKSANASRQR